MELRQIRYFLALSRTLNFTRAAEQCDVTQPTLTLAIKKLEEELGGPLLHRERNQTHLTHLGQMVLPFLEQVFESSHAAQAVARDLSRGERIPLSIGVSDTVDKARLLGPMREIRSAAPGLELSIDGGADAILAERLVAGELDMAILDEGALPADRARFAALYTEEMCALLPDADPLAARNTLTLADLAERPWIALSGSRVHGEVTGLAHRHSAGRPTEAQLLVLSGLGLTLAGDHEPLIGGLTLRRLTEPALSRRIGIAEMPGRRSSSAAITLVRLLRAQTYRPSAAEAGDLADAGPSGEDATAASAER